MYKAKTPPCHVDDCSISIKLSSTVFRSDLQTADSDVAVDTADQFFFDKNGAVIPYPALRALLFCEDFLKYMEQVKNQFEEDTGSKVWQETDDNIDNDNDDDDDDDDKKSRSKNGKKNSVGKNSQQRQHRAEEIEEEEEEEGGKKKKKKYPLKSKKPTTTKRNDGSIKKSGRPSAKKFCFWVCPSLGQVGKKKNKKSSKTH